MGGMRERIRALRQRLLERCARYDDTMQRDTLPRQATYSFVLRARSIDRAIWLLLDHESNAEAAILLRSQINLIWCFLYMVDARSRNGQFEFDHDAPEGSTCHRRAARYLSWHWVDLNRRNPSAQSREMFDRLVREHGYRSGAEVPAYWYQEGPIRQIRHLADSVGGLRQYDEDYTHLSGVEHSDVTSVIVQHLCGSVYGDYIAHKSTHILAAVMDFAIKICGCTLTDEWDSLIQKYGILADDIARRPRMDQNSGA